MPDFKDKNIRYQSVCLEPAMGGYILRFAKVKEKERSTFEEPMYKTEEIVFSNEQSEEAFLMHRKLIMHQKALMGPSEVLG